MLGGHCQLAIGNMLNVAAQLLEDVSSCNGHSNAEHIPTKYVHCPVVSIRCWSLGARPKVTLWACLGICEFSSKVYNHSINIYTQLLLQSFIPCNKLLSVHYNAHCSFKSFVYNHTASYSTLIQSPFHVLPFSVFHFPLPVMSFHTAQYSTRNLLLIINININIMHQSSRLSCT